ncbi:extracellular solute-binding protein [Paenibacillus sp.]|uniref:extracellular solute-binding protein n=1 Tax=Paenibacillus sp. TaxID=58172 RepID=UPI002D70E861|nr:extracellular solute-binding protein [Paenibacillus sp.]HZG86200.1 extracellular solute-binding protein [Paenibacillus sp.]
MFSKPIRRTAAALAALALSTGCAAQGGASHGASSSAAAKDAVSFTIMANLHTPVVPSPKLELLLEEKTGARITFQWAPDGSYEEKFNASFTTDTLPEAVFLKNAAMMNLVADPIRNGLFWEVGPYLERFPNLRKLNPDVLRNIAVDGKIYGLYQERPLSRQGIIYRKDWADRLGLKAPTTVDELYTMLYRFTYDDPDGNGVDDTIGLTDRNDLVYGAFKTIASYLGTPNGWGEREGKLLPEFLFPEYKDTMDFFRKMHREGVMNKDFPVTSKADQQEMLTSGKAGVYVGAMGDVISLQKETAEAVPEAEFDVHNRIQGPKGERVWATPGFGTVVMFPKSAVETEEELLQVLGFFDRLMDAELANLLRWGVEGEHYAVQGGKAVPIDDFAKLDKEVKAYQGIEIGGPNTIPGLLDPDFQSPVKAKAELLTRDNETMLVHNPAEALESVTYHERGERLQKYITDATYKYILGLIDEAGFDAEVNRWLAEGGHLMIEEMNAAYKAASK